MIMYLSLNSLLKYLFLGLAIFSLFWLLKALFLTGYSDFTDYYYVSEHVLYGQNPYISDPHYFTGQAYPPIAMLFFIPLTFFSYFIAAKIWIVLSILASIGAAYLCARIYKINFFSSISLFMISLVFISFPLRFTLGMGQINTIILLFITLSIYFLNTNKDKKAGIFLALPILLKFFPV